MLLQVSFVRWFLTISIFMALCSQLSSAESIKPKKPTRGIPVASAKQGDFRLIVSGTVQKSIMEVVDKFPQVTGSPMVVEYGSAQGWLKDDILKGQEFEVAILPNDVSQEIYKAGKIQKEVIEIAKVDTAIGIYGDVFNLDVSTPETLKSTLIKAKGIRYSPRGAARPTVDKIFSMLNIKDKIVDLSSSKKFPELEEGEYEVFIYPVGEIIGNKALKNLGPVISPFQETVIVNAVIGKKSKDIKASKALISYLQGKEFKSLLNKNGSI